MNKPPELKIKLNQALVILVVSVFIAGAVNQFRNDSLPWLAKPLEKIDSDDLPWLENRGFGIAGISLDQARQLYDNGVIFIDSRPMEYYREGHIVNSLPNANFRELIYNLDQKQSRLDPVVLYCNDADCQMSEELAYDLEAEGFLTLYVFAGGWDEWIEMGYPVEK